MGSAGHLVELPVTTKAPRLFSQFLSELPDNDSMVLRPREHSNLGRFLDVRGNTSFATCEGTHLAVPSCLKDPYCAGNKAENCSDCYQQEETGDLKNCSTKATADPIATSCVVRKNESVCTL